MNYHVAIYTVRYKEGNRMLLGNVIYTHKSTPVATTGYMCTFLDIDHNQLFVYDNMAEMRSSLERYYSGKLDIDCATIIVRGIKLD